ncbi:MAG: FUSC family protein, partial [Deltaproteobacteria bacterium]|nr:FUSC family protein [Deltaproteobacteria bacterium]
LRKGWMRAGGACCGCFLAVVIAGIFLQQHIQYTLFFFSLAVLGLYLGVTARSGYFWSYFILNSVIISMVAMTQPDITVYITVHRGAAITIGVLVSLVVNVVFFPDYAYAILKNDLERHRMETFAWIREIVHQYLQCDYRPDRVEAKYRELIQWARKIATLLQDASMEMKLLKGDLGVLHALFKRLSRRIEDFHAFYQGLSPGSQDQAYQETHRAAMAGLLEKLDRLAKPEGWSPNTKDGVTEDINRDLASLESDYEKTLVDGRKEAYGVLDFLTFLELIFLLRRIVDDLSFKTQDASVSEVASVPESSFDDENTDLYRFQFLGRYHAIHIPSLKYAIKGSLGIVCVFWFWFWAEIPGGAFNMSVAVVTVLQLDLMSTTHKGLLRFLGCLVGAAAGYSFLGFQVESTPVLCVSIFTVIFIFAYIWGGRPGSAYLGCQAALCYLVAAIHDLSAMTSLAPPTERLAGIFLGVLFTWTINLLVWPEDLLAKFRHSIKVAETKIAAIGEEIAARFHGNRRQKPVALDVTALQSTLQTLLNQVELAADETIPVRSWLDELRLFAEESAGMDAVDPGVASVLEALNPDFIPRLAETVFLLSLARSHEDFRLLFSRLGEREREFQQIIDDLRQGVIISKPMAFRQRFAHTLIICKRLIYRLRALAEAQSLFPAFLVHGSGGPVSPAKGNIRSQVAPATGGGSSTEFNVHG